MKSTFLNDDLVTRLPLSELGIVALVEQGVDVRQKMHENTFQRKCAILRGYGVDLRKLLRENIPA